MGWKEDYKDFLDHKEEYKGTAQYKNFAEFYEEKFTKELAEAKTKTELDKIIDEYTKARGTRKISLRDMTIKTLGGKKIAPQKPLSDIDKQIEEKLRFTRIKENIRKATTLRELQEINPDIIKSQEKAAEIIGFKPTKEIEKQTRQLKISKGMNITFINKAVRRYEEAYNKFLAYPPDQRKEMFKKIPKKVLRVDFPEADVSYIKTTGKLPDFRLTIGYVKGQTVKDPTNLIAQFKKEKKVKG